MLARVAPVSPLRPDGRHTTPSRPAGHKESEIGRSGVYSKNTESYIRVHSNAMADGQKGSGEGVLCESSA
jgi:hypothetical protein